MPIDLTEWPSEAANSYRTEGLWQGTTYPELLASLVRDFGSRTAVIDDRARLTYSELADRSHAVARGLRRLGIADGDRVLLQLPNRVEFVITWFALITLGAVPVHTQPGHRRSEMTHLAALSEATAYVIPDEHSQFDHRELAAAVRAESPRLQHVIVVGDPGKHSDFVRFADLEDSPSDDVPVTSSAAPEDIAVLLLSGGTTGLPKLIPRTHDDYQYNARAAAEVCHLGPDTVYLAALPIAFNYTWNCPGVLGALSVGGTVVMASNPDPSYCFGLIERHGVTITAINPQLAPVWLDEAEATSVDLSGLRVLQIGSARLADDTARQVIDGFGATLQQVFGMAEGLLCLTRLDDPPAVLATTQGKPISSADEVRIVSGTDEEVPEGEAGELLTRGPYTLRGYYRADEHNTKSFTGDGFYRTGDLVRRTPSGHLIVVGRVKDQINRGGEKIAATEVEGHLLAHPAIRSVALVACPDEDLGESSVAFVVVSQGSQAPTRADLAAFLKERGIAAYKTPDRVTILETMPLTPLGKMDKKALTELLPR
ncbi:(2,3-dihydroxybenzoyl)adenylate synthase [Streptomyces sp. NBC_00690]|uniref:(2,3-dihydroxybenzoyl)adenylate synthase n=1 Tax=Streptomyces sp. NBC_00690 TaxID=2975808 RepID=UPI002E2A6B4E|nr:AMP-binding protein [Streptomyces sp. NBC_00690]